MQRLSPTLFLGFMVNSITGEHFIAAAEGANPTEATATLRETYPSAAYQVLTVYQAQSIVQYLGEAQRWPGLPSKVQPKLADLLATQRIRTQVGGLPPLRKEAAPVVANNRFTMAQIQQIQTIAQGMPSETQALAARLLAGTTPAPQPAAAKPVMQTAPQPMVQPAPQPAPRLSSLPPMPTRTLQQPAAAPVVTRTPAPVAAAPVTARVEVSATPAPKGGSLKEALAAMRAFNNSGQPSAFSQPMPKAAAKPIAQPAAPMPSALPASARGVQQESAPTPSPFAVGQVSAISVLKALRTAR